MFSFHSEKFNSIPLPPEVSLEEAFSHFDTETNAFFVLSRSEDEYIQCGGLSRIECTVEVRLAGPDGNFVQSVVGKDPLATERVPQLSDKHSWIERGEVLTVHDAIELFSRFHSGGDLPEAYSLRDRLSGRQSP